MHMTKKLFGASFEESKLISVNLFSKKKPFYYDLGLADSNKFSQRLLLVIPFLSLEIVMYGISIGMAETIDLNNKLPGSAKLFVHGIQYFSFLKPLIIISLFLMGIIICSNILPKKNFMIQRIFGILIQLLLIIQFCFSIMPTLLGLTLGATGWFGFSIICICGLIFFVRTLVSRMRKIKVEMYGEVTDSPFNIIIDKLWNLLKKIWIFLLAIVVLNILTLRIGMWGSFSLWSFICMFAGPIYFGLVTLFIVGPLKMYVNSFYLVKYAEQYRVLWKVTDEQWYGKRRTKKLAKKKLK
ncbi:hypothetical protein A5804_000080 [Enterococcus faecium]|uniref:DUF975 family protein n=2 Tax=Enterococcus faecium TaxID=1352 RepID=A0AB73P4K4_ENTFC|nr:hypothetical protein A5804_000080 [Enterococcus faecium]